MSVNKVLRQLFYNCSTRKCIYILFIDILFTGLYFDAIS